MKLPDESFSISEAAKEKIKMIQEGQKLNVIIFGPSEEFDKEVYDKRVQIQKILMGKGHDVSLGENNHIVLEASKKGLIPYSAEMVACDEADVIVNISVSPGSTAELDINGHFPEKSMVCVDIAHKDGYVEKSIIRPLEGANCKIDRFLRPKDLKECNLATRVIDHVSTFSERKQKMITDSLFKKK